MSIKDSDLLRRLLAEFSRDILKEVPAEDRPQFQSLLQDRVADLLKSTDQAQGSLPDLLGIGPKGSLAFDDISYSRLEPDFDDSVIESQLHAAAELYFIYQYERMRVFDVVTILLRLFHEGRMRIQRGPGARALYLIEKHQPLRYTQRHRMLAYRRTFNYGTIATPQGAVVNNNFHRQFVAFISAIAQYFRDLLIGEVIRGSQHIEQRPFGSQATIQRLGIDMRYALDRATYGNVLSLTVETGQYLKVILEALESPDIRKAFDANNKWDVIEAVSRRHLGGVAELAQRSKMADAGRRLLLYVADNPFSVRDFNLFQNEIQPLGPVAEEWIAAYRMTNDGRSYRGVSPTLRNILGISPRAA